jgi:hypothetical protein
MLRCRLLMTCQIVLPQKRQCPLLAPKRMAKLKENLGNMPGQRSVLRLKYMDDDDNNVVVVVIFFCCFCFVYDNDAVVVQLLFLLDLFC